MGSSGSSRASSGERGQPVTVEEVRMTPFQRKVLEIKTALTTAAPGETTVARRIVLRLPGPWAVAPEQVTEIPRQRDRPARQHRHAALPREFAVALRVARARPVPRASSVAPPAA